MKNKKVLILSEAYGDGHTKAAEAIMHGLHLFEAKCEANVIELGVWLRPSLSKLLSELYLKTLQYSPKIWGLMYRKVQYKPLKSRTEFLLHRILYTKIALLIQSYQPDIIICTHPFPSAVVSRLKRMGLKVPLYTAITDYGIHGSWISSEVDQYFVSSPKVKDEMIKLGVASSRISVTGIPVHPKFWYKEEKAVVRDKLGLSSHPTLLCMGGGLGLGLTNSLLQSIQQALDQVQVLFVTGKNTSLYHSLKNNSLYHHPHFHLYSYVRNIDELMDAADLLITKPGGVTCTEAIAKGLPMLLLSPIPGQEEENMRFIIDNRYGVPIKSNEDVHQVFNKFMNEPDFLQKSFYISPTSSGKGAIEYVINQY